MNPRFRLALLAASFILWISSSTLAEEVPVRRTDNPWVVLRAFLVSYPDRIDGVDFDLALKDWYLVMDGKRLYWAGGRLLTKDDLPRAETWRPYVDYLYPLEIPDPETFTDETVENLNHQVVSERRQNAPVYNLSFYDALYDGKTRARIESHIVRFDYLGKRVSVHESIVEPVKRAEARIMELAKTDPELKAFLATIGSVEGYNWREIRDSRDRSNHSWGIAIDILPKNWGQKNIYWNWIGYWNDKWMLIPLERRWMPPESFVNAFEAEGFIWGGKWLLWDNMHFEYRPELLTLRDWGYTGKVTDEP